MVLAGSGDSCRPEERWQAEEKWQVFLEVTSQQLSQAGAARKWSVGVSTVVKLQRLARDGGLGGRAAVSASRHGI